jgi:hypothetical protein
MDEATALAQEFHKRYSDQLAAGSTILPWESLPQVYQQQLVAAFQSLLDDGVIRPGEAQ